MSLITPSYFTQGELLIANVTTDPVRSQVQYAIDTYEPEYLKAVLGLDLYMQFSQGLQAFPVAQQWLDLKNGVVYDTDSYSGRHSQWQGFTAPAVYSPNTTTSGILELTVGGGIDQPVAGANSFSSSMLANNSYTIERKNSGTMYLDQDYELSNNNGTFTLKQPGDIFSPGEQFVIHFTKRGTVGDILANYESPIARYVYWNYMCNLASVTTGAGEVLPQNENSQLYGWSTKVDTAWNKMVRTNNELWKYLGAKQDVYGTSYQYQVKKSFFGWERQNMFGI